MAQKKGFQGQEIQDELGLNWSSFKWRNADPALGRFINIDPLAEDYSYQSPYNFAENRVIDGIELEGLEHLSHTVYSIHKDTKGNYNATHNRTFTQRNVGNWSGTKHQNTYNVHGSDGNVSAIYSGDNSSRDMASAGISLSSVKNREISAKDIIDGASNNKEFQKAGETLKNVAAAGGLVLAAPAVFAGEASFFTYLGVASDGNQILGGENGAATDGIDNNVVQGTAFAVNIVSSFGAKGEAVNVLTTSQKTSEKVESSVALSKSLYDMIMSYFSNSSDNKKTDEKK
ncbi:hypothetical protein [Tenacibaculum soleae]|uniref:hypothetical protein n=1 Tax=Tenacibaculum soleae TaxID=447689 RepID=UPI0026E47EA9|nr:hypothetical protein [Tenacibaculum soleae]MDO6814027.1 hypothetical protein [Tenacibaculum soleae]